MGKVPPVKQELKNNFLILSSQFTLVDLSQP